MLNEADTRAKLVDPKLRAAGWGEDRITREHYVQRDRQFTPGRIYLVGDEARRKPPKKIDYVLRYSDTLPIAVVEAKDESYEPGAGLQQAKDYAEALDVLFAYSTNGHGIVEFDRITNTRRDLVHFPSPEDLWDRFESEAAIAGRPYTRILDGEFRWSSWARKDWPSEDLLPFIHGKLLPHLRSLSGSPERDIIRSIFADRNVVVCASPFNLKDVLQIIDQIDFQNADDIHTVSFVYEDLLKKLGSENRLAGEFYTPRPIVRFMVEVVDPKIGETVYDPACGSCGFLAEAYVHMKRQEKAVKDYEILQRRTFFGQEKKPIPTLLGVMNLVLHGVLAPNVVRRNTLEENIRNVTERFDVILTNPPFGGTENRQIQQNFPVQSQATELLFLQHILKKLKATGSVGPPRCGMVVPEGTLFRGDAFALVKKDLLENFNLHTVVSLPAGVFLPYSGVKTNLLFFERTGQTKEVWYYELLPPSEVGKYTKGKPIQDAHFDDCREKLKTRAISENSWIVPVEEIVKRGYDLTAKNPNRPDATARRTPEELTVSILKKEQRIAELLEEIQALLETEER